MRASRIGISGPSTWPVYHIRVKDHIDFHWADWFDGLTVTLLPEGITDLSGPVPDQAALHALLERIRDLNLTLLSIMRENPE